MPDSGFLGEQAQAETKAPETPAKIVEENGEDEVALAERETILEAQKAEEDFLDPPSTTPTSSSATQTFPIPSETAPSKDDITQEVEKILEDGLKEYFQQMPHEAKEKFRAKGFEISTQIATMVRHFQVRAAQVLRLIREWLLTIPGVNKFFLEQEAKIKTDRIRAFAIEREKTPTSHA